jgi:hypothetical protein
VLEAVTVISWDMVHCVLLGFALCLAYFLNPKLEAACFSKMLLNFDQATRRHIPEDSIFQGSFMIPINL